MVVWLIGLSGAGKTTIGRALYNKWKVFDSSTVFVDGDEVRNIFSQDKTPSDYSLEGRRQNAELIFNICKWLDSQNLNVVCCLLSLFPELQARNRVGFSKYFEVFVQVPIHKLIGRDNKGLYGKAIKKETKNVVGIDIEFPDPPNPDLVIDNKGFDTSPEIWAQEIAQTSGIIDLLPSEDYRYARGDLMGRPNTYKYTQFHGAKFLGQWWNTRQRALRMLPNPLHDAPSFDKEAKGTAGLLEKSFKEALSISSQKASLPFYVEMLLKKFEVSNRIYDGYDENLKPVDKKQFRTHAYYVRAAESFEIAFYKSGDLRVLNVFLKCMDTLTAHVKELDISLSTRLARLILKERDYVNQIASKRKIKIS